MYENTCFFAIAIAFFLPVLAWYAYNRFHKPAPE